MISIAELALLLVCMFLLVALALGAICGTMFRDPECDGSLDELHRGDAGAGHGAPTETASPPTSEDAAGVHVTAVNR